MQFRETPKMAIGLLSAYCLSMEILELGWTVDRIKMRGELGNVAINLIFNVEEIPAKTLLSS